jgi:hypothetical protein
MVKLTDEEFENVEKHDLNDPSHWDKIPFPIAVEMMKLFANFIAYQIARQAQEAQADQIDKAESPRDLAILGAECIGTDIKRMTENYFDTKLADDSEASTKH